MPEQIQSTRIPSYYSVSFWRRWAKLYDRVVRLSFVPFGGEKRFRQKFVAMAGLKDTDRVLDICCGTGSTTALIAPEVCQGQVIGVDLSPDMLAVAQKKNVAAWVSFQRASVDALPFSEGVFDHVFCSYGLHELPREIRAAALKEVRRVLKPGGKFLALDYGLPKNIIFKLPISAFVRLFENDTAYKMMKGSLAAEIIASGLDVIFQKRALGGMFQIISSVKTTEAGNLD
ncbi:class I SAM-dependent methyltransferase [Dehalogenimonas alkenigignens]|uniref:Methylase involved in ubiquinone/menaquinone biosynthesis n=1 Tax=Dehalogenimonas alkenigignens TaxID=1217799 RepID=A0A0W0GL20_9CHLR|nr:class I SAM-dependent methyltransferase [Dehalogenimonas alkenigignens]KTB49261.1 Methylase involved in ubiquinone/menaquinone biosynthesis [Dehalogenimonas alkenigignens]PVV83762.1 methyltransferase domain-containing protein [Dehalogenimonas alkenigignens]